ncbi:MAG: HNH endonuclease [Novosphingobium sp.]|uniref:HNH endonuclease n=1 Tax=Novosphingobium sp. TaxID=1874826 RepID=UPI00262716BC|nr:HNH endonuclease [Novosphingobium sp.]MCP5385963.1 HNH endonuclease [Novosphingobium sp.]
MSNGQEQHDEAAALERLTAALDTIRQDLRWYWRWGDGQGGWFMDRLAEVVRSQGETWPFDAESGTPSTRKEKIPRRLARAVMERDAYRCVSCGSHIDLTCDHIVPESKGGPTALDNLQTMCRPCNSRKGNRT